MKLSEVFAFKFGISSPFSPTPDSQGKLTCFMGSESCEQVFFHRLISSNIALFVKGGAVALSEKHAYLN